MQPDWILNGELLLRWERLLLGVQQTLLLCIPRCYYLDAEKPTTCQLVGFCDASQRAYAVVIYFKIRSAGGCVVRFVTSRTRVAPLSAQTIPRLELLAALLFARLLSSVLHALQMEQSLKEPLCFTDSKITLFWIKGSDKMWRQFVQNRVIEIQSLVLIECWHQCPSELNPADLPSRGADLKELTESTTPWLTVPYWICESDQRQCSYDLDTIPDECMVELKVESWLTSQNLLTPESTPVYWIIRCENFNSLGRLLRVTAHVSKFIAILKSKSRMNLQC